MRTRPTRPGCCRTSGGAAGLGTESPGGPAAGDRRATRPGSRPPAPTTTDALPPSELGASAGLPGRTPPQWSRSAFFPTDPRAPPEGGSSECSAVMGLGGWAGAGVESQDLAGPPRQPLLSWGILGRPLKCSLEPQFPQMQNAGKPQCPWVTGLWRSLGNSSLDLTLSWNSEGLELGSQGKMESSGLSPALNIRQRCTWRAGRAGQGRGASWRLADAFSRGRAASPRIKDEGRGRPGRPGVAAGGGRAVGGGEHRPQAAGSNPHGV